ncbi:hypothetical protein B0E54_01385 [Micromonospora sp. MH99]|nr:hypothetical protein [Micromonospora sp. MH99]
MRQVHPGGADPVRGLHPAHAPQPGHLAVGPDRGHAGGAGRGDQGLGGPVAGDRAAGVQHPVAQVGGLRGGRPAHVHAETQLVAAATGVVLGPGHLPHDRRAERPADPPGPVQRGGQRRRDGVPAVEGVRLPQAGAQRRDLGQPAGRQRPGGVRGVVRRGVGGQHEAVAAQLGEEVRAVLRVTGGDQPDRHREPVVVLAQREAGAAGQVGEEPRVRVGVRAGAVEQPADRTRSGQQEPPVEPQPVGVRGVRLAGRRGQAAGVHVAAGRLVHQLVDEPGHPDVRADPVQRVAAGVREGPVRVHLPRRAAQPVLLVRHQVEQPAQVALDDGQLDHCGERRTGERRGGRTVDGPLGRHGDGERRDKWLVGGVRRVRRHRRSRSGPRREDHRRQHPLVRAARVDGDRHPDGLLDEVAAQHDGEQRVSAGPVHRGGPGGRDRHDDPADGSRIGALQLVDEVAFDGRVGAVDRHPDVGHRAPAQTIRNGRGSSRST